MAEAPVGSADAGDSGSISTLIVDETDVMTGDVVGDVTCGSLWLVCWPGGICAERSLRLGLLSERGDAPSPSR